MRRRAFRFLVASAAGLGIWLATMATAPQGEYVSGARTTLLWLGIVAMALALGYVFPEEGDLVALGLVASPLLTAGWTAPRGDEDGL